MATHPDIQIETDLDVDVDFSSLPMSGARRRTTVDLNLKMQNLEAEVEILQNCLLESLSLQKTILNRWGQANRVGHATPAAQPTGPVPVATSTPWSPTISGQRPISSEVAASGSSHAVNAASLLQSNSLELNNTSRVLAAALHQAKMEPPVFANDGTVRPDEWLQSVNTYRTSLGLTEVQILSELPRFLAKEPRKWFRVLSTHVVTWTGFCEFFKVVFLPSDNQECVMRGILDCYQASEEPLPTFVAHMLSEFKKLKSPPPGQEQIELICKHALEKYRVALYGTPLPSVMTLLLRAHELHSVLGPSSPLQPPVRARNRPTGGSYCFKCSLPGFTSRTCPNCTSVPQSFPHPHRATDESTRPPPAVQSSGQDEARAGDGNEMEGVGPFNRQQGNARGGRMFRRGDPPSRS